MQTVPRRIWLALVLVAVLFIFNGCRPVLRELGWTETQIDAKEVKDQVAVEAVIDQSRSFVWETATVGISVLGTLATAFLAKWIRDERQLTATVIKGVEKGGDEKTKSAVTKVATQNGISGKLAKRVLKLT